MADAKKAAAKSDKKAEESKGQGRAVVLPNGQRRIDYIRDEYYKNGKSRSDIKKAINEMLPEGEEIAYQIVFAATKTEEDPRNAAKADEGSEKK